MFSSENSKPTNLLAVLYRQNVPEMILKWECRLLILILQQVLENASMKTSYVTKIIYLKKDKFCIQKMNNKK